MFSNKWFKIGTLVVAVAIGSAACGGSSKTDPNDPAVVAANRVADSTEKATDAFNAANNGTQTTVVTTTPGATATTQPATSATTVPAATTTSPGQAPQTVDAARALLKVPAEAQLTKLNPRPGDDLVIGWVIGSTTSEAAGQNITAGHLPAGVCVDFDPGATKVNGDRVWEVKFTPLWNRALLKTNGSIPSGLKATIYWTPCNQNGGTPVS